MLCAAIATCVAAYSTSLRVGYCMGEIAEEGVSKVGKASISCGIVLPSDMLAPYAGAVVTAVRVGLVTAEGVSDLSAWVRTGLEEDDLDASAIAQPAAGWNDLSLAGGVVIDGSPLAVGYTFSQEKSVKCISLVGDNRPDGKWIAKNGKWEEAKNDGVLSVELVIESDNLPSKDLAILSLQPEAMPVAQGEEMAFTLTVRNNALADIDGFVVNYGIEGNALGSFSVSESLAYGKILSLPLAVATGELLPDRPLTLDVEVVCDGDDAEANNRVSRLVGCYTRSVDRNVLVEEFTTEMCGNCPRAINTLKQCENAGYGPRMTLVAHHVGYNTDWLTVEEDAEYLWFFDPTGQDGTFAPAVMLDRTVASGDKVPVRSIGYFTDFEPVLQEALAVPAFVFMDIATPVKGDLLTIDLSVVKLPILDVLSETPKVTVYIIEDDILHHNQAGITSDTFTHNHVYRRCVTGLWGDDITWVDNEAVMTYSVKLEEDWNRDNLSVVAFVHDYDGKDVTNCRVYNSAHSLIGNSAVEGVVSDMAGRKEYYTIDGMHLTAPAAGICIEKTRNADGTVTVRKISR